MPAPRYIEWETVAIPFASGIQPAARPRLLEPQKLLTAQNCYFFFEQGPQKRNGHVSHTVRTGSDYPGLNGGSYPAAPATRTPYSTSDPGLSPNWLYGWGVYNPASDVRTTTTAFEVSPQPNVGNLFGTTTRDTEIVAWDGHRVFSYAPQQPAKFGETQSGTTGAVHGPATMPALRAAPIAKIANGQTYPDAADNGVIRLVAWINGDSSNTVSWSVFDSKSGACLVANNTVQFQTPKFLRAIAIGPWVHVLVADSTANSLELRSIHQDTPTSVTSRSVGTVGNFFDVKKIDETKAVVARVTGTAVGMSILNFDGNITLSFTPDLNGSAVQAGSPVAVEVDRDQNIGLVWNSGNTIFFRTYTLGGAATAAKLSIVPVHASHRVTLSPKWVRHSSGQVLWDIFAEDVISSVPIVISLTARPGVSSVVNYSRLRVQLASHAFRVGDRNFVWLSNWLGSLLTGSLQWTWFLCDSALLPVGKMDYGLANVDLGSTILGLSSVNWRMDSATQSAKDRIVFHGCMNYRNRVTTNTTSVAPNGRWAEPSIRFYELDFLPPLRAAQAGRCAYFAGAQLWAYDGVEMNEATFHCAPEGVTLSKNVGGGALGAGDYKYRVDLCYKNAQNEEVRSWSIITAKVTTAANDSVSINIPHTPMTRREDAYLLIYRTEASQTTYYLINSRDPAAPSFIKNDRSTDSYTYLDVTSDLNLITQEYHPANSGGNYLEPLPAPACELVFAGRDRLWLAGGELTAGEVAPSRLFVPGDTPTFSPALNVQVDRNSEPITAIGFVGDAAAIFRRTATYILESDGPDNVQVGTWSQPRLALADVGAVGPEGLALTVVGLWFQTPSGLRLLSASGTLDGRAGQDVDPITIGANYSSAVVVPQYTQVRWYARSAADPTLVLDYSSNSWSTWTNLECTGAVFWPTSNLAVLAKGTGDLWTETTGLWSDAGSSYEMIIKVPWLHGGNLGDFQRVRRMALYGLSTGDHTIRTRIYYDERPFHDEEFSLTFPATSSTGSPQFNPSLWGGDSWGSGSWGDGDQAAQSSLWFRDNVYRFRHRMGRQKCAAVSIEFSDLGAMTSSFQPVVLALEIGKKTGLERIPT